jgi:tetraacyldisaccharide 4'-kinase
MDSWLQRVWYGRSLWAWLLWPLAIIFALLSVTRRWAFRVGILRSVRVGKPIVVIGNITVGGTGKTPLVIWLAQELSRRGFRPAVITRGYGGNSAQWPIRVTADSDPRSVGDEAVLIAQRGDIVIAGPDRVADAQAAIALGADVIVSDDGLQHYRLARDAEIAVVDGARVFGNGHYLPAGPLRESIERLDTVTAVVVTDRDGKPRPSSLARWHPLVARNRIHTATSLLSGERRSLTSFTGAVHAIAGIGNPSAFFSALAEHGLQVNGRALPDHAQITKADLEFNDAVPVFMTEKDAVKCRPLADARMWVVPVTLEIDADQLLTKIEAIIRAHVSTP